MSLEFLAMEQHGVFASLKCSKKKKKKKDLVHKKLKILV